MDMLAARLYGKNDLRVESAPIPEAGNGELLLRVKAAAVCGTDLRMLQNGAAGVDESHPLICAHEFSGIVEEAGAGVDLFRKGDRVAIAPNIGCGVCDRCASGMSHHCKELRALGVHIDGGFAQYALIPAEAVRLGNVVKLAPDVSFEAAAANEALSCVYNAYERYAVNAGDTVVIIGAGAIGLMHAKLAKLSGAAKIIMSDLSPERLKLCAQIEPALIIAGNNLAQCVSDETSGNGAQVVITACSSAAAQRDALEYSSLDGRVNFFGGLPKGKENVSLDTNLIHYKQLYVTGTTRASHAHYRKTLRMATDGIINLDSLITHRFALGDIGRAFENTQNTVGLKQAVVF